MLCSTVLVAATTGTLSAFTASLTDAASTASAGQLVLEELDADGDQLCTSASAADDSAVCDDVDAYGDSASGLDPGDTSATTVLRFQNTGATDSGGFALTPGACSDTVQDAGDLCAWLDLTITCSSPAVDGPGPRPIGLVLSPMRNTVWRSSASVYDGVPLSQVADQGERAIPDGCVPQAGGDAIEFDVSLRLDQDAPDSAQGQSVVQSLKWTLTSA